jgi:protein-tyrosine phosphatase
MDTPGPGLYNLRDLGGLPTRDGGRLREAVLYRSNAPLEIGEAEREFLTSSGIRRALDLRDRRERDEEPIDLGPLGIEVVERPIYESLRLDLLGGDLTDGDLASHLNLIVDEFGPTFTEAIGGVCGPDVPPTIVYCSNGKDRTGIFTMLVLEACGVEDEAIAEDFHLTEVRVPAGMHETMVGRAQHLGLDREQAQAVIGAAPEVMVSMLAHLRKTYGGAAGYLERFGLGRSDLDTLVGRLT